MSDIFVEAFWDILANNPWPRRAIFVVLFVLLFAMGWLSWSLAGLITAIWGVYEFADILFAKKR